MSALLVLSLNGLPRAFLVSVCRREHAPHEARHPRTSAAAAGVEVLFKGCTSPSEAFDVITPLARSTAPKTAMPGRGAAR